MATTTETFRADLQETIQHAITTGGLDIPAGSHLEVIDCNPGREKEKTPQWWKIRLIGTQLPLPGQESHKNAQTAQPEPGPEGPK